MKQININNCSECPFAQKSHVKVNRLVCNEPHIQVIHPYSEDRLVDNTSIAKFCPLQDAFLTLSTQINCLDCSKINLNDGSE